MVKAEQYPQEISAGFIIINIDPYPRVLLVKAKATSKWGFPKGHVEEGETYREAALRELYEETGFKKEEIEVIEDFEESVEYEFLVRNFRVRKKVYFFLAITKKDEIVLNFEHVDGKWFSINEALQKVYPNLKPLLLKAFSRVEKYVKGRGVRKGKEGNHQNK